MDTENTPPVSEFSRKPKVETYVDYTKLEGADFLHALGTDANKWATAFMQRFPNGGYDHGDMLAWFANAIVHAQDTATGHVCNGDQMEYMLEKGINPKGDLIPDSDDEPMTNAQFNHVVATMGDDGSNNSVIAYITDEDFPTLVAPGDVRYLDKTCRD